MKILKFIVYIAAILFAMLTAVFVLESCAVPNHLHRSGFYVVDTVLQRQPGTTTVKLQGITKPVLFLSDTIKAKDTLYLQRLPVKSKKINVHTN